MADHIEIDYEQMTQLRNMFEEKIEQVERVLGKLNNAVDDLRGDGFKGEPATAFFQEMDQRIMPALRDLKEAMELSRDMTINVAQIFEQAEEESEKQFPMSTF